MVLAQELVSMGVKISLPKGESACYAENCLTLASSRSVSLCPDLVIRP